MEKEGNHYFNWIKKIADYLVYNLNCNIKIYTNKNINILAKQSFSKKIEIKPTFNTIKLRSSEHESICSELKSIDTKECDFWLITTLSSQLLLALLKINPNIKIFSIIHFIPGHFGKTDFEIWKMATEYLSSTSLDINFFVTVKELQIIYTKLLKKQVTTLPYIFDLEKGISIPKTSLEVIGFFGQQRKEKGLFLLEDLINLLLKSGKKIILQDSLGTVKVNEKIDNLIQLNYVENISEQICKCDLIIAPYHHIMYKYRMSAIVIDALSNGIPVIAPSNTASGNFVEQFNAGVTFDEFTAKSIFNSFKKLESNYSIYSKCSFETQKYLHKNCGIKAFINTLISKK